jgi:hypothetical protein
MSTPVNPSFRGIDGIGDDQGCTCLCTPCAEFGGCEACPDCASGCEACGYPYPEAERDLDEVLADLLDNAVPAPAPDGKGPRGFTAQWFIIDDPGPWLCQ